MMVCERCESEEIMTGLRFYTSLDYMICFKVTCDSKLDI